MSAGIYNGEIERGATWPLTLQYTNAADEPHDLTDCVVKMQIRPDARDTSAVLYEMSSEDGDGRLVIVDAEEGRIEITIPAEDTVGFTWFGDGVSYDVLLIRPTGKKEFIIKGTLCISDMVTEDE